MEKEKRVKHLPVVVQFKKIGAASGHPNVVRLSQGAVRQEGEDLIEDIRLVMPEKLGEDAVSLEIRPMYLSFPGPQQIRLFAREAYGEDPRWAKAFCYYDNGQRPEADYIDNEKGQAGMGGGDFVSVYANRNETLLMCHVWLKDKSIMVKNMLTSYWAKSAMSLYAKHNREKISVIQEKLLWALEECKCEAYVGVVVHTLKKVWDTNGYVNKVFAILPEDAKPEAKKAPIKDSAKELVDKINTTSTIVEERGKGDGRPKEDNTQPRKVEDPVEEARSKNMAKILTAPTEHSELAQEATPPPPADDKTSQSEQAKGNGESDEKPTRGKGHDRRLPKQKAREAARQVAELQAQPA